MKTILFVCAALIAGAFAAPAQEPKTIATDILITLLDWFRVYLPDLSIGDFDIGNNVHLSNVVVKNLETFVIEAVKAPLNPLSMLINNLTLSLAEGSANFDYNFDKLDIPGLGDILSGSGPGSGAITGGRIEIADIVVEINGLALKLKDFGAVRVSVSSASLLLDGIDQATSDYIASLLSGFLDKELDGIIAENENSIIKFINQLIADIVGSQ